MIDEMAVLKRAVAQEVASSPSTSVSTFPSTHKVDVPKPPLFKGSKDAKEIDNFLWSLE